jgi:hypothetical protein
MVIAENTTARSIHSFANHALKHGTKLLDAAREEIQNLELLFKIKKLMDVLEKMWQAVFERDALYLQEETTKASLKTTKKELADAKKELKEVKEELVANAKVDSHARSSRALSSLVAGGIAGDCQL